MTKEKFLRTALMASGELTEHEKARMAEHSKLWIARAFQTGRVDRPALTRAITDLYVAAGLKEPRVVIVPSPKVMAFAGGFASAIWWLRKNGGMGATDISAATWDATLAATLAATEAATEAATWDATSAATEEEWPRAVAELLVGKEHVEFALRCASLWASMYQGGNMWAPYDCYLTAARDILQLQLAPHKKYEAWERAAIHGGFRIMHEEFCMVCEFPDAIKVDAQNRPHCADGPSHQWMDGWKLYHAHGVRLPEWIVERPELISVQRIESESNAEIRRVMMERYGYARYMRDCGARIVDQVDDTHELLGLRGSRLLLKELPDEPEPIVYIDMVNSSPEPDGSFKRYLERVDPKAYSGEAARSCHAAMASRWRYRDETGALQMTFADWRDYQPSIET